MNANELADEFNKYKMDFSDLVDWAEDAAPMLRQQQVDKHYALELVKCHEQTISQQQAEIEQCKREIDELYECLKEAVNNHKTTHLHPFWVEYRKRKAQEK